MTYRNSYQSMRSAQNCFFAWACNKNHCLFWLHTSESCIQSRSLWQSATCCYICKCCLTIITGNCILAFVLRSSWLCLTCLVTCLWGLAVECGYTRQAVISFSIFQMLQYILKVLQDWKIQPAVSQEIRNYCITLVKIVLRWYKNSFQH